MNIPPEEENLTRSPTVVSFQVSMAPSPSPPPPPPSEAIRARLSSFLSPLGFDVHPFLAEWYNQVVSPKFKLSSGEEHSLAFVVISRPSMFEGTFLPFLLDRLDEQGKDKKDPLDECMKQTLARIKEEALGDMEEEVVVMHDFELLPNRRPKILAQSAAHVSGAVRFIREEDVQDKSLLKGVESPKIYPVCVHPELGGWFAIRAVVLFPSVLEPSLPRPIPVLPEVADEDAAEVLRLYNDCWRDWRFRDAVVKDPAERYSKLQQEYFAAPPSDRWKIVQRVKEEGKD